MIELSYDQVDQIMHKDTPRSEDLPLILRSIYLRYLHLFETYFADIDALDDDKIIELKKYHEETRSLIKIFYLDIPMDVFYALGSVDEDDVSKMLSTELKQYVFDSFRNFMLENRDESKSKERFKLEFAQKNLTDFYSSMDTVFRGAFGTTSKTTENAVGWIGKLLFGEDK